MRFDEFIDKLPGKKLRAGNGILGYCPGHNNTRTQSLSVSRGADRILLNCKGAGCSAEAITSAIGLTVADLFYEQRKGNGNGIAPHGGLTIEVFSERKALPLQFLAQHGVHQDKTAIVFQYLTTGGQKASRQRLRLSMEGNRQWLWNKGDGRPIPYGCGLLDAFRQRGGALVLCEGESDSLTLWFHEINAIGIPGADMCSILAEPHIRGFSTIIIAKEPDQGGDTFVKGMTGRLAELRFRGVVKVVKYEKAEVKDASELHLKYRSEAGAFESELGALVELAETIELLILGLEVIDSASVVTRPVRWLWPSRIPQGKLTLFCWCSRVREIAQHLVRRGTALNRAGVARRSQRAHHQLADFQCRRLGRRYDRSPTKGIGSRPQSNPNRKARTGHD